MVLRGERISNDPDLLDNLQVWVENDYNPDLLDSNLSFPLLKELMELGDLKAKRIFKEVVAKRFLEGPQSIREVFCNQGYFDTFSKEERRSLFKSGIDVIEKLELLIDEELKKEEIQMLPIVVSHLESIVNGITWKEGDVVGLKLFNTNFKELPEFLRELKNLEFLSLETELLESIPDWIAEFKSLKYLELGQGILSKLPESIGQLSSLECLKIWHNKIESIPESIGDLSLLKVLRINKTQLKSLPYSITKLESLKNLDLLGNKLSELPNTIGNLKELEQLIISENPLLTVPKSILNLKKLNKITLRETSVSKESEIITELKAKGTIVLI